MITNRHNIWKAVQRTNVSKGPMERIKNIYDKCDNSVVIDGKKSLKVSKVLRG
jgi:hypothetical protein